MENEFKWKIIVTLKYQPGADIVIAKEAGYKEVYFGREGNTGRIYIAIKGNNNHCQIAQLDEIAIKTLIAFLTTE